MKITVDSGNCIGCGVCVDIAEKSFEMKDGKSQPIELDSSTSPEIEETVKMAVECCPVQAIATQS
ncbi:MAG: Ferredoxin [Candidatus Collierbacteria bacterium GW2011_GWB1_44_6]|uniref:Ferredoxin n=2 Tax=Candidatus Collieribacteriota TaxID=1752725 RepID=A0A0G1JQZ2_9BACT|nr:MAG: Ferredoxin [Candidatus Collierbacteria bacterium GW2011_GWC2_43_12]KKT73855.1 MAG: Ferredoxin [Candidatus Collierbacteria bacterium GW2011_GWB1_44_6]KKT84143.1 MAG: 4Fe-4S ferredoxin [Microgenomates group bacterium GW2011_GWC1_44_9]